MKLRFCARSAGMLRSDQTAASVRRYYTTRPSLVLHLCTVDHRNQPTPEIKAGQENIAHLLSKYNSKLLVHFSAIISSLRCLCYAPIIFFLLQLLITRKNHDIFTGYEPWNRRLNWQETRICMPASIPEIWVDRPSSMLWFITLPSPVSQYLHSLKLNYTFLHLTTTYKPIVNENSNFEKPWCSATAGEIIISQNLIFL